MSVTTPIYLDNHSTTRCDPSVVEAMLPYFSELYGNAASRTHRFGFEAKAAVELARERVAALIGSSPKEVIWSSGATEANNLALIGAAEAQQSQGRHIIISQIEHKSIIDAADVLEHRGWRVTRVAPDSEGIVPAETVCQHLCEDTTVVSLMLANNEIGTIQPIRPVGEACRARGIVFHVDAVQAAGRTPIRVVEDNVDLLTLSAHKMYGPKGVGALYVRRGRPRFSVQPIIVGGGHERGMRSGTLPVPLIVGMGYAAQLAEQSLTNGEVPRIQALRDMLWQGLTERISGLVLNGHPTQRLMSNLNFSVERVESQALMMALRDLAVSSGSACSSASLEPSYVLRAMGLSPERSHASIRVGLGRFSTEDEVSYAIDRITKAVQELREMSPLYEPDHTE